MCNRVARHGGEWLPIIHADYTSGMKQPWWSRTFARRARLSTFAIASAVTLTLAAVVATISAIGAAKREAAIYGPSAEIARGAH